MNILMSLLLIILVVATTGFHAYFVWKRKDHKTLFVQMGIVCLTIIAGIFIIYDLTDPSISKLFNMLSPLEK